MLPKPPPVLVSQILQGEGIERHRESFEASVPQDRMDVGDVMDGSGRRRGGAAERGSLHISIATGTIPF